MRRRTRRRSISSWLSPSPLPPIPCCRLKWPQARASRGSEYSIRASSTCKRASRVRARAPKISRITSSRSITAMPLSSSHLRCWPGDSSLSKMMTSQPSSRARSTISCALPEPIKCPDCGLPIRARMLSATSNPSVSTSSASSTKRLRASSGVCGGQHAAARSARVTVFGFSGTANIAAWKLRRTAGRGNRRRRRGGCRFTGRDYQDAVVLDGGGADFGQIIGEIGVVL
jgi:hypothetical protein